MYKLPNKMYIKQRESEYLLLNCPVKKKEKKEKVTKKFFTTNVARSTNQFTSKSHIKSLTTRDYCMM